MFQPPGNLHDVIPIISDLVRLISTFFDVFMLFLMFASLYLTDRYLDGLSMPSPYYSIPIRCVSDLLQPFVDFIYLRTYRYSDVLIIYSYG